MILAEGLPVGAWREKLGLPGHCRICERQDRETLQHAFLECEEVQFAWTCLNRPDLWQASHTPTPHGNKLIVDS